jgi:hypothetical protein
MTITYKIQPYQVHITTKADMDDIHASFSDREWAENFGGQFTTDSLVVRIDIQCIRAGEWTHVRSWNPEEGWNVSAPDALRHFLS